MILGKSYYITMNKAICPHCVEAIVGVFQIVCFEMTTNRQQWELSLANKNVLNQGIIYLYLDM